jgi:hypothetical protein
MCITHANPLTKTQDGHWTSHSDFVDGKFYRSQVDAAADLNKLLAPSSSPLTSTGPGPVARPTHTARSVSTSSTSTVGSDAEGVKFEVRKIAARALCGSYTWWFVDEQAATATS